MAGRRSNPMKDEIATPFGLAMTVGSVKILNAFVLITLDYSEILLKPLHGEIDGTLTMSRFGDAVVSAFDDTNLLRRPQTMKYLPSLTHGNGFVFLPVDNQAI